MNAATWMNRMNVRRTAAAIIVAVAASHTATPASAQQSRIIGVVIDAATGAPLVAASVHLIEHDVKVATNGSGHFILKDLAPGTYTLEIRYIGYESRFVVVRVGDNAPLIRIVLRPKGARLH